MNNGAQEISRLCRSCGFCCNGVLFENVRLREEDHLPTLRSAGVTLKKKGGCLCVLQPCAAWRDEGCTVYTNRPVRCREFLCHQILQYRAGAISQAEVLRHIQEVKELVASLRQLLREAGSRNEHRPLLKRCEMVLNEADNPEDEHKMKIRKELRDEMSQLEQLLYSEFRVHAESSSLAPEPTLCGVSNRE